MKNGNHQTFFNMGLAMCSTLTSMLTGLIVQRYILVTFNSSINGLTSSITQFLSYLMLLEAGLSTASIQALYEPLAQRDNVRISRILAATSRQFIKVGLFFLAGLVILTAILPIIIGDQVAAIIVIPLTFMSGLGHVLTYMLASRNKALLHADNRVFVIYLISIVSIVTMAVLKLLIIFYFPYNPTNIIYIGAVTLVMSLCNIIAINKYVAANYKDVIDRDAEPDMEAISKRWSVLIHQLFGTLNRTSDTVLLTAFSTLKTVSVYSVYNYVYASMNAMVQTVFLQAVSGRFGGLYAQNKEKFRLYYDVYELLSITLTFAVMTGVMIMTTPFVGLYTAGVTDILYVDYQIALLFYLAITLSLVRLPSILAVTVAGHFKETQKGAIWQALINIAVSLPMLLFFGIKGLLIGTICAMLWRTFDLTSYSYKLIVHKRMRYYLGMMLVNSLAATICILLSIWLQITVSSWLTFFLTGVAVV
ncbi:hypothetical protein N9B26_07700, partial [Akkermansiaceae bacterium]|nr:hypothetical protein [Akkermansiaceae bacterium]